MAGKFRSWSVSWDGERYEKEFLSAGDAYMYAAEQGRRFWIGECVSPPGPEWFFSVGDWLEHVSCQDEYQSEFAEHWDRSTNSQRQELQDVIRKVMGWWLDNHDLRPKFWSVVNTQEYDADGNPLEPISHQATEAMNPGFQWEGK